MFATHVSERFGFAKMCEISPCGFLGMGRIHVGLQKNSLMRAQENNTCGVSLVFFCFLVTVCRFVSLTRANEKSSRVPNIASCTCKLCNAHLVQRIVAYRTPPRAHVKFVSSKHLLNCEATYTYVAHCL